MELEATGPSVPSVILDEDGNMIDSRLPSGEPLQFVFEEIKWHQKLSWEEAARRLEVAMYPFKKVRLGIKARVRLHAAKAGSCSLVMGTVLELGAQGPLGCGIPGIPLCSSKLEEGFM